LNKKWPDPAELGAQRKSKIPFYSVKTIALWEERGVEGGI
jgi:hypothetical protein